MALAPRPQESIQAAVSLRGQHEQHVKVSGLELFFDLAFVVIINQIISPLEHHPVIFYHPFLHGFLTMHCCFALWNWTSSYIIRARMTSGRAMVIRPLDVAVVFVVMVAAALISVACKAHDDKKLIVVYLIGMLVPMLGFQLLPFRGDFSRKDANKVLSGLPVLIAFYTPAIIWQDPNLLIWLSCVAGLELLMICSSFKALNTLEEKDKEREVYLDALLEERWELITLIAMGEIVAAFMKHATFSYNVFAPMYLTVLSGFAVASACYFLYFNVCPKSWKAAHVIDNKYMLISRFFHLLIVFALPCIGAAYARLLEEGIEELFEGNGRADGHFKETREGRSNGRVLHSQEGFERGAGMEQHFKQSQYLLCFAVCLFLVSTALYYMAGTCNESELKLTHVKKCGTRIAVGIGLSMFGFVSISKATLTLTFPTVLLLLTLFESWAAGRIKGPVDLSFLAAGSADIIAETTVDSEDVEQILIVDI